MCPYVNNFIVSLAVCNNTFSVLRIIKHSAGTTWAAPGTHAAGTGTLAEPTAHRTGLTEFGDFGLGVNSVSANYMYFTEYYGRTIKEARSDGSEITLVHNNLFMPIGIAVDSDNARMYWAEFYGNTIKSSNLDGSDVQTIIPYAKYCIKCKEEEEQRKRRKK